jgi:hypothetical protein
MRILPQTREKKLSETYFKTSPLQKSLSSLN